MQVYVIFDDVAGESGPIFTAVNDGVALRNFKALLKDTSTPGDYKLFRLAEYNPVNMAFQVLEEAVHIEHHFNFGEVQVKENN